MSDAPRKEVAGRELDALVAEAMGWTWRRVRSRTESLKYLAPPQMGDERHFWDAGEARGDESVAQAIDYEAATTDFDRVTGLPTRHRWGLWFGDRGLMSVCGGTAFAETVPLAICRAALAARPLPPVGGTP